VVYGWHGKRRRARDHAWAAAHGSPSKTASTCACDAAARRGRGALGRRAGGGCSQIRGSEDRADRSRRRHFTIAVTHVPKAKRFVPGCSATACDEHLLGRAATGLIGAARRSTSGAPNRPALPGLPAARARRRLVHELFSPAFIVFLIEQSPRGFAFEYSEGTLCVSLLGSGRGRGLDGLRDATVELVRRIRAEISERLGPAQAARSAPDATGFETDSTGTGRTAKGSLPSAEGGLDGLRKAFFSWSPARSRPSVWRLRGGSGSSSGGSPHRLGGRRRHLLGAYALPDYSTRRCPHAGRLDRHYDTYIRCSPTTTRVGRRRQGHPGLATALPKVSDGGKTYTLTLREGLKYSNGEPVVASDFTHSLGTRLRLNPAARLSTKASSRGPVHESKEGGIRASKPTTSPARSPSTWKTPTAASSQSSRFLRRPAPSDTPKEDLTAEPPPATGLRHHLPRSPAAVGNTNATHSGRRTTRSSCATALGPTSTRSRSRFCATRRPRSTTSNRASSTGWATKSARRYQAVKSKYEGSQFRIEPTFSNYFFWMNRPRRRSTDVKVRQAVNYAIDRGRWTDLLRAPRRRRQILPPACPLQELKLYPHEVKKGRTDLRSGPERTRTSPSGPTAKALTTRRLLPACSKTRFR